MIRKILTTYAARLDEYLARSHRQPEGVAEVGLIGSAGEQCPNKLVVSLVNLEREASGDGGYMQRAATGYAGRRQPLLLNMHIMMAAVYEDKRYAEALSVLSDALTFVQSLPATGTAISAAAPVLITARMTLIRWTALTLPGRRQLSP